LNSRPLPAGVWNSTGLIPSTVGARHDEGFQGLVRVLSRSGPQVERYLDGFRQELRELGYVEGQSITIEYRWVEGKVERLPPDLAADVIVASGVCPWPLLPNKQPRQFPSS
jgi:hypothetical protein